MSAVPAPLAAPRARSREQARPQTPPRLRVVAVSAPERARVSFLVLVTLILGSALLGALALNTSMATTSYTIQDRTAELAQAQQRKESLATQVEQAGSPAQVMAKASDLGLVPSTGVTYIDLATMTLVGGQ